MFHLKICLIVHFESFLARLLISLTYVVGSRDAGKKPGLNIQVRKVAPEVEREQRGFPFVLHKHDVRYHERLLLSLGFGQEVVLRSFSLKYDFGR